MAKPSAPSETAATDPKPVPQSFDYSSVDYDSLIQATYHKQKTQPKISKIQQLKEEREKSKKRSKSKSRRESEISVQSSVVLEDVKSQAQPRSEQPEAQPIQALQPAPDSKPAEQVSAQAPATESAES